MSQHLVNQYLNELDRLKKVSGSLNEQTVREAFKDLLKSWARQSSLVFVAELEYPTKLKTRVSPDGTILHSIRVPLGYWEAKDTKDDLDEEIARKTARGYPQSNIIYENGHTAVLIQNREEVMRCDMTDPDALLKLVTLFFGYEREEIAEFRRAVEKFKGDLPHVLEALREQIDSAYAGNAEFQAAAQKFLKHAKDTINPAVTESDVREMLIQHILTEEIFAHVFDQSDFHRENNIARELYALEARFFTGAAKRNTLKALEPYYAAIRANAAAISTHAEKQTFLKVIYENFYKVYNPKAADRLGVVYTPNEIVRFMIDGADWLCKKHFGKHLIDNDVEILDPATGTGTFICELLEHFRGQPQKLAHKYKNELHANEVAILPYYVANLNIEATYAAITGQFAEFPNLCFVDTLDNVAGLGIRAGHQHDLFASFSEENVERVKRQNGRKISVIIGNPPYFANQANENENNKSREYARIDELIKSSYIRKSTAQKTKQYDMYKRFFRWASDRLHDDGILTFVTNSAFIEARQDDGFRKCVSEEFHEIHLIDLKGNARTSGERRRREGGNIFDDQIRVGIAISFWVKKRKAKGCRIFYQAVRDYAKSEEKREFVSTVPLSRRIEVNGLTEVQPDEHANWINPPKNAWQSLVPVASKQTKSAKTTAGERALFRLFSLGVVTSRDDWLHSFSLEDLERKVKFYLEAFNSAVHTGEAAFDKSFDGNSIKWTRSLRSRWEKRRIITVSELAFVEASYRPFVRTHFCFSRALCETVYRIPEIFGDGRERNASITLMGDSSGKPYFSLAIDTIPDLNFVSPASGGTQTIPRFTVLPDGTRVDNITDWGLKQFQAHYEKGEKKPKRRMTKDDIFHYVYGVLHDPVYRETYAINLKREFPRIPFYPDFWAWAEWGECLMALHIGYEAVEPWPLARHDLAAGEADPLPRLKADKDNGTIQLDTRTTLSGVPAIAWTYRLGNRSALEWVLDQYKEKKPKDPTIAARFNTYRFKDHKEKVADLLARVTRVSVQTMEIVGQMASARRE